MIKSLSEIEEPFRMEDLVEFDEDTLIWIDEYMMANILSLSSPKFYDVMAEDITDILYDHLEDAGIITSDHYPELREFVDSMMDVFLEFSEIPKREILFSSNVYDEPALDESNERTNVLERAIENLRNKNQSQPLQRTPEWYQTRYNLLTASSLSKVFASDAQRNSLIYEKCKPFATNPYTNNCNTESPMHWGVKYEPLTVMLYEAMYNTKIEDFGCLPHDQYHYIGASPDGINVDPSNPLRYGRMLEIKNIVNRDITGIPKEEYWVQTQIQMEVCNLDECDFVETRFKEHPDEITFYLDKEHEYKGIILYFIQRTNVVDQPISNAPCYRYMPIELSNDPTSIDKWTQETKASMGNNYVLLKTLYWYLDEFSCVLIPRNRTWFNAALPKIEETWNLIEAERVSGYAHRAPSLRPMQRPMQRPIPISGKKVEVTSTDESNSYTIHNLKMMKPVCLIKLDD